MRDPEESHLKKKKERGWGGKARNFQYFLPMFAFRIFGSMEHRFC